MQYLPIPTKTLQSNVPIAFDVHIRIHQKFLLYIRQGDDLEENRLEKLKQCQEQRLYMKKDEVDKLKDFLGEMLEVTLGTTFEDEQLPKDRRFYSQEIAEEAVEKKKKPVPQERNKKVKLSAQMRELLSQVEENESPESRLERQAQIVTNVTQTAVDVMGRLLQDPESLTGYQIARKAARAIQRVLETSPEIISKLYSNHRLHPQPLVIHSKNVACLAVVLASHTGLSQTEQIQLATAGLLHDMGLTKIENGESLFMMPREELNHHQSVEYKSHSQQGYDLLKSMDFIPDQVCDLVKDHEEDLSGGERELAQMTQILSLANRFDKIVLELNLSLSDAMEELAMSEVGNYDTQLLGILKKVVLDPKFIFKN